MKKIMAVIAAAAVALTLVGCANFGAGKTSGTKWSKTFKLDATGTIKDAEGNDATYSRGFAALSTSKKCSAIETVVSLAKTDAKGNTLNITKNDADKKSVVGLAFDTHLTKDSSGKEFYDFVLVGARPSDGRWYVERYVNVPKDDLKESMNSTKGTMGGTYTALASEGNDGYAGTLTGYNKEDEYTWTVKVTQDVAGTYKIFINDNQVATWKRALTEDEGKAKDPKAYGQVFVYGNAPKDTKINAKFTSNKKTTVGLFADEDEE